MLTFVSNYFLCYNDNRVVKFYVKGVSFMARRRYNRYDDGSGELIGLFILCVLGMFYSLIKRYWWIILIVVILIIIYLLVRVIIDMDLKDTLKKPKLYFEGKSNHRYLEKLQLNKELNKTKIIKLKSGMIGEQRVLYNLLNSNIPLYIMHDLRLSCDDLKAQIDFIVVTKRSVYLLESKNLYGNIDIEIDGTITRKIGKYKKGIKNPITQVKQHENIIDKILKKEKIKIKYDSLVVLTNDDAYVNFKKSDINYREKIIRNDKLVEFLNCKENKKHRIRSEEQVKNVCDVFLKYNELEVEKYNEELKKELREWRRLKSIIEGVQAYIIFNDLTLEELVSKRPITLEQLKQINGIGDFKVQKYGNEIIEIIIKYK